MKVECNWPESEITIGLHTKECIIIPEADEVQIPLTPFKAQVLITALKIQLRRYQSLDTALGELDAQEKKED